MSAQRDPAGRDVSGTARPHPAGSVIVALVLSVGICTALNVLVFAVCWDAIASAGPGISENATQILTGWGGGIVSVVGAVVGYQAGVSRGSRAPGPE